MRKAIIKEDVWGHDMTSQQESAGIVVGDNIWKVASKGDECWIAEDHDDPMGNLTWFLTIDEGEEITEEDVLGRGTCLETLGVEFSDLFDWV